MIWSAAAGSSWIRSTTIRPTVTRRRSFGQACVSSFVGSPGSASSNTSFHATGLRATRCSTSDTRYCGGHSLSCCADVLMSAQQDKLWPPQYLVSEVEHRVARSPVAWKLVFELAEPGDPTNELTQAWPKDRRRVTVGRMVVERIHEDPAAADQIMYDPTDLPAGIEASDDPVLHFRSEVYVESKRRRAEEAKPEITPR